MDSYTNGEATSSAPSGFTSYLTIYCILWPEWDVPFVDFTALQADAVDAAKYPQLPAEAEAEECGWYT